MSRIKTWFNDLPQRYKRWRQVRETENASKVKEKPDRAYKSILIFFSVVFSFYALTIIFPLAWMLFNSIKTKQEFFDNPWPPPQSIMIINYVDVFKLFNLWSMLFNSLSLSLTIPTVSVFVTSCVAYAVAKYRFPGRKLLYFVAVAIMFIPTTGSLPITFRLVNNLALYDTLLGMIIMGAGGFGFNFLILHGIFSSISSTYAEAAKIDGAGNWRIFLQIMMPQAKVTIFALWILGFIGHWNDFASAYMFYPTHETLSVGLKRVSDIVQNGGEFMHDYPKLFAAVLITITPVIIIFISCQKIIIGLNMGGGIKE